MAKGFAMRKPCVGAIPLAHADRENSRSSPGRALYRAPRAFESLPANTAPRQVRAPAASIIIYACPEVRAVLARTIKSGSTVIVLGYGAPLDALMRCSTVSAAIIPISRSGCRTVVNPGF